MNYQSITAYLHDRDATSEALEWAIEAARLWQAHLTVICCGISTAEPGFYYAGAQAVVVQRNVEMAQETADLLAQKVQQRLAREVISWEVETYTLMPSGIEQFFRSYVRFTDLLVLPTPYAGNRGVDDRIALEAGLFATDVPVVVVPENYKSDKLMERILIAWSDTPEALSATRAAIPILSAAKSVEITIVDPDPHAADRSDPGGRLAQFLSRHGANVTISVLAKSLPHISEVIDRQISDSDADLVVMGAYGHSRIRETILGGTTLEMLRNAKVPMLMTH